MIITLNLILNFIAFSTLAAWYFWPWLNKKSKETALQVLIWPHVFRHIGMMFLAAGAVKTTLPEAFSMISIWIFNIWGTADLLYAVTMGILNHADEAMGATFWIPAVIVPMLLVSHIMVFMLLTKKPQTNS